MGYSLEYPTEDSQNEFQQEIEEREDEWESWNEIPIMMYGEEVDTGCIKGGYVNSSTFDDSDCKELDGEEEILWEELDPHIVKLLGKESSHYQTTWIEEEAEYLHENKLIENVRYGQGMQESECRIINESRTRRIASQVDSSKVKKGEQKPMRVRRHTWALFSALTLYTIKNWKQHEWSERDKIDKNWASLKYEGEKEGIG